MGSAQEKTGSGKTQEQLDQRSRGLNVENQEGKDNRDNRADQLNSTSDTYKKSRGG
jgi:hypothetical protein